MANYYWKLNNGEVCLYQDNNLVVPTGVMLGDSLWEDKLVSVDQFDKVQLLFASCDSASLIEFVKTDQGMRATQILAQAMLKELPKSA